MSYHYRAYGLAIASGCPCPELSPGQGAPDVTIEYGQVPDFLANARAAGVCYQAAPDQLLLKVDGVARYLVSNGRQILIQRDRHADDEVVRVFLLSSAWGALLHQRGLLPLHGSAVEIEGRGVIFAGPSGMGKSTLAAAFCRRGRRILADDVSVIAMRDGVPMVFPACSRLELWPDAIGMLGLESESLRRVRPELEKRSLPLEEKFCREPVPLGSLYVLRTASTLAIELTALKGMRKLMALVRSTYRPGFLRGLDREPSHLEQCVGVADHVKVCQVRWPLRSSFLAELAERVEKDL